MRFARWIAVVAALVASPLCNAAGFDCAKASMAVEHQICDSPALSALDAGLAKAYVAALITADGASKSDLRQEQRHWITFVRDVCDNERCLADVYQQRIDLLKKNQRTLINEASCEIPTGKSCRSVVRYRDPSYRIESFNRSMKANDAMGAVIGCDRLIDLPVGYRNANHSFGGYCTIQLSDSRKRVKICNDDMSGRFALEPVATGSDVELRDFTNERCYGG